MLDPRLIKMVARPSDASRASRHRVNLVLDALQPRDGPSGLTGMSGNSMGLLAAEAATNLTAVRAERACSEVRIASAPPLRSSSISSPISYRGTELTFAQPIESCWRGLDNSANRDQVIEDFAVAERTLNFVQLPDSIEYGTIVGAATPSVSSTAIDQQVPPAQLPTAAGFIAASPDNGRAIEISLSNIAQAKPADPPLPAATHFANLVAEPASGELAMDGNSPPMVIGDLDGLASTIEPDTTDVDSTPTLGPTVGGINDSSAGPTTLEVQETTTSTPATSTIESGRAASKAGSPIVSATVASSVGNSGSVQDVFQIRRLTEGQSDLRVRFAVQGFRGVEVVSQEQNLVIPMQSAIVGIKPKMELQPFEVVTLTVRQSAEYQVARPAATIFLVGETACSETSLFGAYKWGQSSEAFKTLVDSHRPDVLRACQKVLGNWADAEDVAQFVFLMLAGSEVRFSRSISSWLHKVARNASIAALRSRTRRNFHEREASKHFEASDEASTTDQLPDLGSAMSMLPPALRDAVQLRYLDGLTQREAAELVGCPRGTLSQRAATGIQRLRTLLTGGLLPKE